MRIDKVSPLLSSRPTTPEKSVKSADKQPKAYSSDRIEIGEKVSIKEINQKLQENITKLEKQRITPERLEEIKEKISQNNYFVSTEEIVKKIL
ncbi:MAG: hypothetical protein GX303_08715 [Clostridiales bacterium]|nr:hypothetical protein [Clostridiales bacterium]